MGMLSIPALRYTSAAARLGSFTAAAREQGVAQPTVSNAVAELEEALGARLFERSTRRLSLTPAGAKLVPLFDGVLAAVADVEREAATLKRPAKKLVRIGFSSLVGAERLALLLEPFQREHRDVDVVYKECALDDMEARLEAGTVDVVCGVRLGRHRTRSRQLLYREELRFVAPHGGAARASVTLRQAAAARLVLTAGVCGLAQTTRELFARAHIGIDEYAGHAISYAVLEEWAGLGIGGAILPASHIRKAASAALLDGDRPVQLSYEAVWKKTLLVADHVRDLVTYLRTTVPRLAQGLAHHA
jgi:DNA-binding transcriptional LysR family regulator